MAKTTPIISMAKMENERDKRKLYKYFVSGGIGALCTIFIGHPLDTIKVRLQTMPKPKPGEQPLYSGVFDCASKMIEKEGFKGLYKGSTAPLITLAPIFALSFFGFGVGKHIVQNKNEKISNFKMFFVGAFAGLFTTTLMVPTGRTKILLQGQIDSNNPKYTGCLDVLKKLYKQGGIRSIYKGTLTTLGRDLPASGMYYMTYEWLKIKLNTTVNDSTYVKNLKVIFAGGMAGILHWIVGMPSDVIKSRLQMVPELHAKETRRVFKTLLKEEGVLALYTGITPVMIRAFPANGACFIGFEACMSFLNKIDPDPN